MADDRLRAGLLVSVRGLCLVFDRPRRPPRSRRADRFRSLWVRSRLVAGCLNVHTDGYLDDTNRRLAPNAIDHRFRQSCVAAQRGGDRPREFRSQRPAHDPHELFGDDYRLKVMVAVLRRALDVVAHWPSTDRSAR